ncbi:MAG TPA: hypothetical protein PL124_08535 [Candidatus Cloacimonadota bacterium]|nr:hypothetical protein [Candidatus Cloacimonadota bacterium]
MKIIGIDPGHLGGIVIIDDNSVVLEAYPMPLVGDTYDYHKMLQLFIDNKDSKVAIEKVGFMGVATANGIADLCYHAGVLYGLALSCCMPVILVPPAIWKKKIGLPPIGITRAVKGETAAEKKSREQSNSALKRKAKTYSIEFAIRTMPSLVNKVTKVTDGIAEAALIAEYARRSILPE